MNTPKIIAKLQLLVKCYKRTLKTLMDLEMSLKPLFLGSQCKVFTQIFDGVASGLKSGLVNHLQYCENVKSLVFCAKRQQRIRRSLTDQQVLTQI